MRDTKTPAALAFAREGISAWDESIELLRPHQAETRILPGFRFAPDRARYETAERAGILRVFTGRDAGGRLGAFATLLVGFHPEFPDLIFAAQTTLFVAPAHRGRGTLRFIRWQDAALREGGVHAVYRTVTRRRAYARALESMDYKPEETRYLRDLRVPPRKEAA